jgi:alpha-beta hydrolase superfamily lysophospholipase
VSQEARPIYFPSAGETLFGWLHTPQSAVQSDIGVVLCNPFGYEAVSAHQSLRTFADTCAAAGTPALRFDYSCTGDSSGTVAEQDLISRWCDDIQAAIDFLERSSGVRRVCLIGVRLGALLAGIVASQRKVDALIAVAPVTSGRRYLRELRAFQAAADGQTSQPTTPEAPPAGTNRLDVTGFQLPGAAIASLERIDLSKLGGERPLAALLLDRDDLPAAKAWAAALETRGVEVQYAALPGFNEMVSTPHAAQVPAAMLQAMTGWLGRNYPSEVRAAANAPHAPLPAGARMRFKHGAVEIIERAMFIDGERTLFAVATEPAERAVGTETSGYGVVLLNTGATNHIGPNRMYVELARSWAARGYVVLRLDLAGLGDSNTRAADAGNQVYPPGALYDIGVAIEFLRRRRGVRNVTLAGVCAGAYHSLRAAVCGLPVNTIMLINPLTFYWKPGSTLSDLQISEVVRNPGVYAAHARSLRYWARLLTGKVNLWRVAKVVVGRVTLALDSTARELCRRLGIRIADDLGWDLKSVVNRGIRIVFFFARGDGGAELLQVQGGSIVRQLGTACRIHTIDNADHIFTQHDARLKLLQLLHDELPY